MYLYFYIPGELVKYILVNESIYLYNSLDKHC